ncbi:type II secretion system protein N [Hephaestia mangrovi]|uniref:type II secretion system protein N n=1 Tax=Hephaestia mangrovi TaxID=2873268 RepID=UPI001CA73083|nr:type II secretion system protein N [Hephaestia mangrovi]MBY8827530.1 type II secretory protein PulC [Hephaestia mangrovi]
MRLVLSGRARALLRRLPRANVYSLAEIVLIALLAVQCARLVWVIVTPVTPLGDWRPAQPGGASAGLLGGFDPFFRFSGNEDKPAAVTSLQLTLYGIRVNEATGGGSAIIAGPDGEQKSVAVGGEIMPGATLKAVAFDHITIDRGGTIEDLYIDQSKPVTPSAPTAGAAPEQQHLSFSDIKSQGLTLAQITSGIGFIPRIDDGRITGLVLRPNGDGQAFAKAGLQQGDIVTEVMGKPVTGPDDIANLKGRFDNGGILSLMVERGAKKIPIGINVTGS